MIKELLNLFSKLIGLRLNFRFFTNLFIGIIIGVGVDYFTDKSDIRFRIFIYGISIILTFIIEHNVIHKPISLIKHKRSIKKVVNKLSHKECNYVFRCYKKDEFFNFSVAEYSNFLVKWQSVLYINVDKHMELYGNYKICVDEYALKLIQKKYPSVSE